MSAANATNTANTIEVDVVVIGGGPAGMHAAIEASRHGRSVMLVDEEPDVGGACVRRGTIPSKTLRETAMSLDMVSKKSAGTVTLALPDDTTLASLLSRTREVVAAHERTWGRQLRDAHVDVVHGRVRFTAAGGPHAVLVQTVRRETIHVHADRIVIATGSRPRMPDTIHVDHESVLDSDSILSLPWLPKTLIVLGGGVIATEYASIFACLGVEVVCIDRAPRPLGFLDGEIVDAYLKAFSANGGRFIGGRTVVHVEHELGSVQVCLDDGSVFSADKVLCALGRTANVESLQLGTIGLGTDARGLLQVDDQFRTALPHILAVGDVIGPPSLASTAQGRRAGRVACGIETRGGTTSSRVPVGVYAVPEMAAVGLSEREAHEQGIATVVGRAAFKDTARGVIAASEAGFMKLVASADGQRVLGVQVVGEGAAELVHLGQLAMLGGLPPRVFVEEAFNFPTMAEAYRIAALDIAAQVLRTVRTGTDFSGMDDDECYAVPI